jgi:hypothetical protein
VDARCKERQRRDSNPSFTSVIFKPPSGLSTVGAFGVLFATAMVEAIDELELTGVAVDPRTTE